MPRRAGLAETRRAVVFVIVGVPLWPLAMFWDGVRLRGGKTEKGGTFSDVNAEVRALVRGMLRVPAKGGSPIRLHVLLHLGCAPRQSSDTEGTQRPGALLLRAGGFPSYSFGSRRVRAAIKEPSQPCAAAQRAKPHPPDIVWALHTFWVAWLARARASAQTAAAEPTHRSLRSRPCSQHSATNQADACVNPALLGTPRALLCADTLRPFADGPL